MKTKNTLVCCYCGIREATTKDHIPPKAIFPKPRPNDLITVPACFECNNEASKSDESFKTYLGMHVARFGGDGERLFKEGVLKTTKHNNKLRQQIIQSMTPRYVIKDNVKVNVSAEVVWDNESHDLVLERIVRGLFFHHFELIIANNANIKVYWQPEHNNSFDDILLTRSIANGNFLYQFARVEDGLYYSMWKLRFFNGHFAVVLVMEEDIEET
jgi:hypothetical protein